MSEIENQPRKKIKISNHQNIIFYDLETNGVKPFYKSAIMQISFKNIDETINQNIYVYPYDNIIGATEIHNIDAETLSKNNAQKCDKMLNDLLALFSKSNETYYFVAYNNFGFDQNVLERHFKIFGLKVPENWLFIDILPYIQDKYQHIRQNGGYKLSNVYDIMCKKEGEIINFHNAQDDVYCLGEIYKKLDLNESKIKAYIRGGYTNNEILNAPISSLNGYAPFLKFVKNGIKSINDLYLYYIKLDKNMELFRLYLKQTIGIYSEMYLNKICEQIIILDDLLYQK